MSGGGQERGMRSGTLPTPLVVGLGEACAIAQREMDWDYQHVCHLAKRLLDGVNSQCERVVRNGDPEFTYPGKGFLGLGIGFVGVKILSVGKKIESFFVLCLIFPENFHNFF